MYVDWKQQKKNKKNYENSNLKKIKWDSRVLRRAGTIQFIIRRESLEKNFFLLSLSIFLKIYFNVYGFNLRERFLC